MHQMFNKKVWEGTKKSSKTFWKEWKRFLACTGKLPASRSVISGCSQRQSNGGEGNRELCYLSRAKEYFLVSLSLTRQALSRPFVAAMRKVGGVLLEFSAPSTLLSLLEASMGKNVLLLPAEVCQILLNEKVLIIFSISPLREQAAFLVLVASLTCQSATCWVRQIGGLRPPSLLVFLPPPGCLMLWYALWSCSRSMPSCSLEHTDVEAGTGVLEERMKVIKTTPFAWKQPNHCLPFCFLS